MARLKEYNGHYCESEYEYAFIGFLEAEVGSILLVIISLVSQKEMY